ncbi:hypothetical protein N7465_000174 [Penicillium sp. CMV-2018d]|nr:hypothetical protein N7465_000174 [Penicillium sp. CMV-2018d]
MLVALREENTCRVRAEYVQTLFAYCLRSSVVSVLFSLISESSRSGNTLIIPIFGPRDLASVLAYILLHSVIGLTLPAINGNSLSFLSNCPLWQHFLYMIP